MTKLLDNNEIDQLLARMKEIQANPDSPLVIKMHALKIEVSLLQMDIYLIQEDAKKHGENLRDSS